MRIAILVDRRAVRRWQGLIRERLGRVAEVKFCPGTPGADLPGSVAALLTLERVLSRGRPEPLFDVVDVPPGAWWAEGEEVDLTVDLAGGAPTPSRAPRALRLLFDGQPSEEALVGALLARAMPEIAVVDGHDGAVLATGRPSPENGGGLTGGLDAVLSRAVVLLEGAVSAPRLVASGARPMLRRHRPPQAARMLLRSLARDAAYAAYKLCMFTPHWRVGWRRHDGPGVIERRSLDGPAWQTIPDPGHRFFADPFPIVREGREVVFVEDFDHRVGKGTISAIEIVDGVPGAPRPVLEEPWHLSYPFLIEQAGELYMLPEASLSGAVTLYRCRRFPDRWERCATLLAGVEAADATILRHGDLHWMFAVTREGYGGYSDTLRLWHAPGLFGPWREHGLRPVMVDIATARPAGAVVASGGALWRPFQDCAEGYGTALGLSRITRLDPESYDETVVARLKPGPPWPGRRVHTLNRCGPLECIDGSATMPRLPALRPWIV